MYKDYYLMQDEPFTSFPSPHVFYKSKSHIRAWKNLVHAVKKKEQVVMVAGDYGTGKTLLCLKLLQYMEKYHVQPSVYVPSSGFSFSMVLEKIAKILGVPFNPSNNGESQRFIYDYFEAADPDSYEQIFIVIDDIQEFDHTFISELGKLVAYNYYGKFPLRLYLFGHKSFFENLEKRNLLSFKQRIRIIPLLPLSYEDVTEYIYFRLITSGASGTPVFEDSAVELIAGVSKGLPRLINKICDASLVLACKLKVNVVDRQVVSAALAEGGFVRIEELDELPPEVQKTEKISVKESPVNSRKVLYSETDTVEDTPSETLHSSQHLFAVPEISPDEIQKRQKKTGKKDLKKSSFLDGKTVAIIILIVILGFLVLFFIREIRLDSMPLPEGEIKPSSMITRPIPFFDTGQPVSSRVHTIPDRTLSIQEPISNSNDMIPTHRLAVPDIQPIIHEFSDPLDKLPVASKNIDNDEFQLDDHLIVYYEK